MCMIKIKLTKTYELDNQLFENWCRSRGLGKWVARVYIRDKIYKLGEDFLKKEGVIK
tara:strand:+ start:138 stop:308 length:171 start_codon:yes stop_codon:yes gene_type:complete